MSCSPACVCQYTKPPRTRENTNSEARQELRPRLRLKCEVAYGVYGLLSSIFCWILCTDRRSPMRTLHLVTHRSNTAMLAWPRGLRLFADMWWMYSHTVASSWWWWLKHNSFRFDGYRKQRKKVFVGVIIDMSTPGIRTQHTHVRIT